MSVLRVRCPRCDREIAIDEAVPLPRDFPFCSERCRLVDLNRWFEEEYKIGRPLRPGESVPGTETRDDDER